MSKLIGGALAVLAARVPGACSGAVRAAGRAAGTAGLAARRGRARAWPGRFAGPEPAGSRPESGPGGREGEHVLEILDWLHERGKLRAAEMPGFDVDVEETLRAVRAARAADPGRQAGPGLFPGDT